MLKGFDNVFRTGLHNEIQDSLVEYFDFALLEKGNYFNVTLGETDYYGNDYSKLTLSDNPNFSKGEAWEGFRKNWVWQSGVTNTPSPLVGTNDQIPGVSGVYVDGTFYPSDTTGAYAHKIDHFNGRVVFDTPIATGSLVQAEFSYKYMNVIYANSLPWLREVRTSTLDVSKRDSVSVPTEMEIQLPAIAIEIVPEGKIKPFQIGPYGKYVYTDILWHCIAEDAVTRNNMIDIISMQHDSFFTTIDAEAVASGSAFPINALGYTNPSAKDYRQLVNDYPADTISITNIKVQGVDMFSSNLYAGVVRGTIETITDSF